MFLILNQFNLGGTAAGGLFIFAPQPGDAIGGSKISDNNSPMPRDRAYVIYNHFQHAFGTTNIDLGRVAVEKSFGQGRYSVEVRVPFANTVSSTQPSDGSVSEDTELGNVVVNLKSQLYRGDSWLLAGGCGVTAPTASDARVTNGANEIVRINNESVHVLPFLGALWAPQCSKWFAQGFVQSEIDTHGNPVTILGNRAGEVQNTTFLYLDAGVGYMLYQTDDCSSWVRSVAPIAELHYNVALEDGNFVRDPSGITVGSTLGALNILNLTLGGAIQLGNNTSLSASWVTPLTDQQFNWEANVALNIRFGPTGIRN